MFSAKLTAIVFSVNNRSSIYSKPYRNKKILLSSFLDLQKNLHYLESTSERHNQVRKSFVRLYIRGREKPSESSLPFLDDYKELFNLFLSNESRLIETGFFKSDFNCATLNCSSYIEKEVFLKLFLFSSYPNGTTIHAHPHPQSSRVRSNWK